MRDMEYCFTLLRKTPLKRASTVKTLNKDSISFFKYNYLSKLGREVVPW